jgi:hypothetical protein
MSLLAPTNVAALAIAPDQIKVTWTNAQNTHGDNMVEVSPDAGANWYIADATGGIDAGVAGDAIAPTAISYVVTGYDNTGIVSLTASTVYSIRVTALCSPETAEVTDVTINSVAADLDGEYFDMADEVGPVRVWFDLDAASTPPTTPVGGRLLEVDVTAAGETTAALVAAAAQTVINGDTKFSCSVVGAVLTITSSTVSNKTDASAGSSGVTINVTTNGCANSVAVNAVAPLYTPPLGDPDTRYWVANPGANDWTHIMSFTGVEPIVTAIALGLDIDARPSRSVATDITNWIWGPEIGTKPAFPA